MTLSSQAMSGMGGIKRVTIDQLLPGMYIHDLNCGWLNHPFVTSRFTIENRETVHKIGTLGIREVYIDTRRGLDLPNAPTSAEVNSALEQQLQQIANDAPELPERTTPGEEMARAGTILREAAQIVTEVMQDARLGRQIEVERLEPLVERMTDSILRNQDALICLTRLKDKDDYTFLHSVSVSALLIAFARSQGFSRADLQLIGLGGLLHDVGKTRVPDEILNKPGRLTDVEFAIMKGHVDHSREILAQTGGIDPRAVHVALQHHERYDGSGYPEGLAGDAIAPWGQMAAIVDVYDAITSNRVYHKGMEPSAALRKMLEWGKFHFNEKLVHAFVRTVGIYPAGSLVLLESGRLGVVVEQHEGSLLAPTVRVFYSTRSRAHIAPREIDLSRPVGHGGGDRIVGYESWADWGLDPERYIVG